MDVIESLSDIPHYNNLVITLGNFDGIHIGHQELIRQTIALSRSMNGIPAVFTFDPHPLKVLKPDLNFPMLLTKDEKIKMMSELGVKVLIIAPFSRELSDLTPEAFVKQILVKSLNVRKVVVGYNYSFGSGGAGDAQLMSALTKRYDIETTIVSPVTISGVEVSSTLIRGLLIKGDVETAAKLLGYIPYIKSKVVHGEQRGRQLGYPTANFNLLEGIVVPANGVYAVNIITDNNKKYYGVANIGIKPTFKNQNTKNLEVHIFDFQGDIYGHILKVGFIKNIRGEKRFASAEELVNQIKSDAQTARKCFSAAPGGIN